ncbi:MAG TPA: NAD(+) diphosphatase [Gammaproteobacteria bacterium]|nr:NAD(+) diphosphatase [Gammaproteobacteria bacterium]
MNIVHTPSELGIIPAHTLCLFYYHDQILVLKQQEQLQLPTYQQLDFPYTPHTLFYMDTDTLERVLVADLNQTELPANCSFENTRNHYHHFDATTRAIIAKTFGFLHWYRTHRFCSRCSEPTVLDPHETAMVCPQCQHHFYPMVNPSMIVLVHRGPEILLARSPYFPPVMFSVLAGYVAPGESLEQTVAREVKEEVNLDVKNIRYMASQAWPFPNVLMLGFFAEYAGGEIKIDPKEIEVADWFTADNLPPIPRPISIARQLIDTWLQTPLNSIKENR